MPIHNQRRAIRRVDPALRERLHRQDRQQEHAIHPRETGAAPRANRQATIDRSAQRPRITYQVTEAGTREFERLMSEVGPTAWEDDNFDIRFAFFARTDMEIRLRVLEGRRTRLQERLERVQRELAMTQKEVDRYAAELQRHGVESVEREVRWLSELINAERSGSTPGPPTSRPSPSSTTSRGRQQA